MRGLFGVKINNSITKKITLGTLLPTMVFSLLFSLLLYFTSVKIIDDYVVPQFERILEARIQSFEKIVDMDILNQAKTDKKAYEDLLSRVNKFKEDIGVENVYVMSKVNGKDVILVLSGANEYLTPLAFTKEQEAALHTSKPVISGIYKDDYGIHKSIFIQVRGTDSVLGIDEDAKFISNLKRTIVLISVILTVLFVCIGALIAIMMSKRLTKPLHALVEYTQVVAEGDLTKDIDVKSQDEIGKLSASFDNMRLQLREMIQQVSATSEHVVTAANDLSHSTEQTTHAINQIAIETHELASHSDVANQGAIDNLSSLDGISVGIKEIAASSSKVSDESFEASRKAEQGNVLIRNAVKGIDSISDSVVFSKDIIQSMHKHSTEVGEIVQIITGISEQINLLALNAAIEAARAGEYGRGFSVVADEVRKLAEQSTKSASEIGELITQIQSDSNSSVTAMNQVVQKVEEGTAFVHQAGDAFEGISTLIGDVAEKIQSVSATIQEVAATSQQVLTTTNGTLGELQKVAGNTQSIAASTEEELASMEEVSASVNVLKEMATSLQDMVKKFKV